MENRNGLIVGAADTRQGSPGGEPMKVADENYRN